MQIRSGHFIADGNAVNVDVGFVPDLLICFEGLEETNPQMHWWLRELANITSGYGQYGILDTGGTKTKHAAATNGFAALDSQAIKVLIDGPAGEELSADPPSAFVAGTAQPTARTTTAIGTLTKPSSGNETGFIYECTTSTGVYGTEPTWPTTPGGTVTDDQSNVWTCREYKIKNVGVKGFTLGATGSTDSDVWAWVAVKFSDINTEKDAASYDYV